MGKKPRNQSTTFNMGTPTLINSFSIDATGQIVLYQNGQTVIPVSATTEISYSRNSKNDKITTRVPISPIALNLHPVSAIKQFDLLFAVDTSWPQPKLGETIRPEENIAVTCAVLGKKSVASTDEKLVIEFSPIHCVEFWGVRGEQERIGWAEVLVAIMNNPQYSSSLRIGLIVDAYFQLLPAINNGNEPVFGDVYLPNNITIIYASSDAKNDSILNRMLYLADKESKQLRQHIISSQPTNNLIAVQGKPYSHIRLWTPK